jgi:hypothetical protein
MTDEKFERFVHDAAREYHRPPEVPREEMWHAIRGARTKTRADRRAFRPAWIYWAAGVAAALVLGIGIGRVTGSDGEPAVASGAAPVSEGTGVAFELATTQHLGQVELFLADFRSSTQAGRSMDEVSEPAHGLLATTRILLDSPIAGDGQRRTLLEDIELVLMQIAQVSGAAPKEELDLIDQSLEQRSVLFRLHSATAVESAGTDLQGAL